MDQSHTLAQQFVKGIDYFSEEYVKQLLENYDNRKTEALYPFCNTISYPSDDFLNAKNALEKSRQFGAMTYVGFMDMLLPPSTSTLSPQTSFTLVKFKLDGKERIFVQVCQPDAKDSGGNKFYDFVMVNYPNANSHIPFNRSAIHVLSDISITGSAYKVNDTGLGFSALSGSFVPSIEFEIAVSGFQAKQT